MYPLPWNRGDLLSVGRVYSSRTVGRVDTFNVQFQVYGSVRVVFLAPKEPMKFLRN